jgi:rod shape-determining protein MreB
MPVQIAEDPLTCVVRGTGRIVESLEQYSRVLAGSSATRRVVV